jgi:hypothetical protein
MAAGLVLVPMDYGFYAFAWVAVFYYALFKNTSYPILAAGLALVWLVSLPYGKTFAGYQLYAFISVPLILCLRNNDNFGRSKAFQLAFYIFYPAHLAVLAIISAL